MLPYDTEVSTECRILDDDEGPNLANKHVKGLRWRSGSLPGLVSFENHYGIRPYVNPCSEMAITTHHYSWLTTLDILLKTMHLQAESISGE